MLTIFTQKEQKLSRLLTETMHIPYQDVCKLLRNKDVKVNSKRTKDDIKLAKNDYVEVFYQYRLNIVFQDENILIINKPRGIPSEGDFSLQTAVNSKYTFAELCHRLDTNTEGLLVFSLNNSANMELLQAFKSGRITKHYTAILICKPPKIHDIATAYLLKNDTGIVKVSNSITNGVKIITEYTIMDVMPNGLCMVDIVLHTGKTHQIRAHMAFLGAPVLGDGKYGNYEINKKYNITKQQLSANKISFNFDDKSPLSYLNKKTFEIIPTLSVEK